MKKGWSFLSGSLVMALLGGMISHARAGEFQIFDPVGSFALPGASGDLRALDVLVDGRLLVAHENGDVFVETGVGSRSFALLGVLPITPGINLTFLRVSPSGTTFAVGDFNEIARCTFPSMICSTITAAHFEGYWFDDQYLLVTNSFTGTASMVDVLSADPQDPEVITIVESIPGFAAGIVVAPEGSLLVGTYVPGTGGVVRAFGAAEWQTAWNTQTPLDFSADGPLVVNTLSAVSLGFDVQHHFHIGGFGDKGSFVGLADAAATKQAMDGVAPVNVKDVSTFCKFYASDCTDDFYIPWNNKVTRELYVRCFSGSVVDVYRPRIAIPAVSHWGLMIAGLLAVTAGTLLFRRARPASELLRGAIP